MKSKEITILGFTQTTLHETITKPRASRISGHHWNEVVGHKDYLGIRSSDQDVVARNMDLFTFFSFELPSRLLACASVDANMSTDERTKIFDEWLRFKKDIPKDTKSYAYALYNFSELQSEEFRTAALRTKSYKLLREAILKEKESENV